MNAEPHIHVLNVSDQGTYWNITYGDQNIIPQKPSSFPFLIRLFFAPFIEGRDDEDALKRQCRKVIARHDEASKKAGERRVRELSRYNDTLADTVARELQPHVGKGWGSTQLK